MQTCNETAFSLDVEGLPASASKSILTMRISHALTRVGSFLNFLIVCLVVDQTFLATVGSV